MLNIEEIKELQSIKTYPCVSILAKTHRTFPDNKQDSIRIKNLVNEAKEKLLNEFSEREISTVLSGLDELVESINYDYLLDGVALFVNSYISKRFDLPFRVGDRVVINKSFAIKDLVYAYNRSPRYQVLLLSEQPSRLFEGYGDKLVEVINGDFPRTYKGPGVEDILPDGKGIDKSAYRDEMMRQFFREVDEAYSAYSRSSLLPLVLTGVDRNVSYFKKVSPNFDSVIAVKHGSFDKLSSHGISGLIHDDVEKGFSEIRMEILGRLQEAIGQNKYSAGLDETWRMAQEGRVDTLLVNRDFNPPAVMTPEGMSFANYPGDGETIVVEDAVDELIESVIEKGGNVLFFEKGELDKYGNVAALLRY